MLKIPTRVRYATTAMVYLATRYGEKPVLLKEIAQKEDISESYLENLMVPLRVAGLVKTSRGTRGGYNLARPPSAIGLSEIVAALDGPLSLVECIDEPSACARADICATRDIWTDIERAVNVVLKSVTLEGMAQKDKEKKLLRSTSPL